MDLAGSAKESGTHATHAVEWPQNTLYMTLMIRCLAYHPWCRRIGLDGLSLKGTMRPGPRHMGNKCRKESMKKWTTIYGIQLVSFLKLVYSPSRYFALPALIPPQLSSFCSSLPLGIPSPSFLPSNPPSPAAVSPPSIHPTLNLTSPYHRARTLLSFCPFAAFSMSPLTALARLHCLYNLPNRNHNSRRMPARTPHHHPSTVQPHHHRPPLAFALYIRQLSLISQALYDFSRYQFDTVLCKYLHRVSLCASYIRSI